MGGVLEQIGDSLGAWAEQWLLTTVIGVLAAGVAIYFIVRATVVYGQRWKEEGSWRRPLTLLPKEQFLAKQKLLAHQNIREFYAPPERFTRERAEKEWVAPSAWRAAYRKAVAASIRDSRTPKHSVLEAIKQIREAGKWISVHSLPDDYPIAGDRAKHYMVEFGVSGKDREAVAKLGDTYLSTTLDKAHSVERRSSKQRNIESWIVHEEEVQSVLTVEPITATFYEENPAVSPNLLPLAMTEGGKVWSCPSTHIFIFGMTGAGKGSAFNGIAYQLAPHVKAGIARIKMIDLKMSEALGFEFSSLVEETTYNVDGAIEMINEVMDLLVERNMAKRAGLSFTEGKANLQRKLKASKEHPNIWLMIDEFYALSSQLQNAGPRGKQAFATLTEIMSMGRALGIYIVAASTNPRMEALGTLRDNFTVVIVMRNKASDTLNEMFLGAEALAMGLDPRRFEESTEANNYGTAGLAYVATGEGGGDVQLIRFAYPDDEDLARIIRENPNAKYHELVAQQAKSRGEQPQGGSRLAEIPDDDEDTGGFAITDLAEEEQLPDFEEFELFEPEQD